MTSFSMEDFGSESYHWMPDDLKKIPDFDLMLQDLIVQPTDDFRGLPVLQWETMLEQTPTISVLQPEGPILQRVQQPSSHAIGDEYIVDPRDESAMNLLLSNFTENIDNDASFLDLGIHETAMMDSSSDFIIPPSCFSNLGDLDIISYVNANIGSESESSSLVLAPKNQSNTVKIKKEIELNEEEWVDVTTPVTQVNDASSSMNIRLKFEQQKQSNPNIIKPLTIKVESENGTKHRKFQSCLKPVSPITDKVNDVKAVKADAKNTTNVSHPIAKKSPSDCVSTKFVKKTGSISPSVDLKQGPSSPSIATLKPGPKIAESTFLVDEIIKQANQPVRKVPKSRHYTPPLVKTEKMDKNISLLKVSNQVKVEPTAQQQALPTGIQVVMTQSLIKNTPTRPAPTLLCLGSQQSRNIVRNVMPNITQVSRSMPVTILPKLTNSSQVKSGAVIDTSILNNISAACAKSVNAHQTLQQNGPISVVEVAVDASSPREQFTKSKIYTSTEVLNPKQSIVVADAARCPLVAVTTRSLNVGSVVSPAAVTTASLVQSVVSSSVSSTTSSPCQSMVSPHTITPAVSPSHSSTSKLGDDNSNCSVNSMKGGGIEAMDVGSLLEQFEEVSAALVEEASRKDFQPPVLQSYEPADCPSPLNGRKLLIPKKNPLHKILLAKHVSPAISPATTPSSSCPASPSNEIIEKIKNSNKRKSAIMLPMSTPSKRGRGPAKSVVVPASSRIQKVIQHADPLTAAETVGREQIIIDHDYCFNKDNNKHDVVNQSIDYKEDRKLSNIPINDGHDLSNTHVSCVSSECASVSSSPRSLVASNKASVLTVPKVEKCDRSSDLGSPTDNNIENQPNILPDTGTDSSSVQVLRTLLETISEQNNMANVKSVSSQIAVTEETVEISVNNPKVRLDHIVHEFEDDDNDTNDRRFDRFNSERSVHKNKLGNRNYRQQTASVADDANLFDKLPNYCTVLSHPKKPTKKDVLSEAMNNNAQQHLERDPSPTRNIEPGFNKLPQYYSCFTNSTRYDSEQCLQTAEYSDTCQSNLKDDRSRKSRSNCKSRSRRSSDDERVPLHTRSRNNSRSRSRSSSDSFSSSSSRSRSRSNSSSRQQDRDRRFRGQRQKRSQSYEEKRREQRRQIEEEKTRKINERRVIYVGNIPSHYSRNDLNKRFKVFGEIEEISVHFREHGDNYGFVTFTYSCDAFAAVEKGNEIPGERRFDLCFGGRRQFCKMDYADLDGNNEIEEELGVPTQYKPKDKPGNDFDDLLKQALARTKQR